MLQHTFVIVYLTLIFTDVESQNSGTQPSTCPTQPYTAQETPETFTVPTNSDPPSCTWMVKTETLRTIEVSIPADESVGSKQTSQCLQATDGSKTEKICKGDPKNSFTAKKAINITQDKSLPASRTGEQITVAYKLVNDKECSSAPHPAKNETQSFYIAKQTSEALPADLQCSWTIQTDSSKNVLVYLDVDPNSPTTTEVQCISVSNAKKNDAQKNGAKKICGTANNNKFISTGSDVDVKYEDSVTQQASITNFQVHYRFENLEDICGQLQYTAEETAHQFKVSTASAQQQCTWTVQTTEKRTIKVSIPVEKPAGGKQTSQCLKVTGGSKEGTICNEDGKNAFTSKNKISITQNQGPSVGRTSEQITVEYQLVNDDQCSVGPGSAEENEQSFTILNTETGDIPVELQCRWQISATEGERIQLRVHVDSEPTEGQCVKVSAGETSNEKEICTNSEQSQYESDSQSVLVRYEGGNTKVPNFKVYYKSSAPFLHNSLLLLSFGLYVFWSF